MKAARGYRRSEETVLRSGASESEIAHAMEVLTTRHRTYATTFGYLVHDVVRRVDWVWGTDWTQPTQPTELDFRALDADKPVSHLDFERVRLTRVTALATLTEDMTGEWPSVRKALAEDGILATLERVSDAGLGDLTVGEMADLHERGIGTVYGGFTPPFRPDRGDLWYSTGDNATFVWDGGTWLEFSVDPETTGLPGGAGGAVSSVSPEPIVWGAPATFHR